MQDSKHLLSIYTSISPQVCSELYSLLHTQMSHVNLGSWGLEEGRHQKQTNKKIAEVHIRSDSTQGRKSCQR